MPTIRADYCLLDQTRAAVGRAGNHVLLADRPAGVAGGEGLGFNGGQLLALALGGCFCNDVQYCAEEMGEAIAELRVSVSLDLAGEPLVATHAVVAVHCALASGADPAPLLERAEARCTIANTLRAGMEVSFS
jgi:organic hydroperoxide reductase OsmC/OhrA